MASSFEEHSHSSVHGRSMTAAIRTGNQGPNKEGGGAGLGNREEEISQYVLDREYQSCV